MDITTRSLAQSPFEKAPEPTQAEIHKALGTLASCNAPLLLDYLLDVSVNGLNLRLHSKTPTSWKDPIPVKGLHSALIMPRLSACFSPSLSRRRRHALRKLLHIKIL